MLLLLLLAPLLDLFDRNAGSLHIAGDAVPVSLGE